MNAKSETKRPYFVRKNDGGEKRLVVAQSQAQALRHVVKSAYTVEVAGTLEAATFCTEGGKVEAAE